MTGAKYNSDPAVKRHHDHHCSPGVRCGHHGFLVTSNPYCDQKRSCGGFDGVFGSFNLELLPPGVGSTVEYLGAMSDRTEIDHLAGTGISCFGSLGPPWLIRSLEAHIYIYVYT